jgi:tetratricopeptide (TPR) repeat protein
MQKTAVNFVFAAILAIPALAQTPAQPTAAELLQKGIYAQETAGDLDGAIKIFRQIVDSHPQQRELGAQAQYRLGMALLAKGDTNSASQEIQRLGWDYPDFKDLVASTGKPGLFAGQNNAFFFRNSETGPEHGQSVQVPLIARLAVAPPAQPAAQHEAMFNFNQTRTVTGSVVQVAWSNPYSLLTINNGTLDPPLRVFVASANTLEIAGWTRDTVKLGDRVTVTGAAAIDGSSTLQATEVTFNGQTLFSRPNGPLPQNAIGAYEK